ncbi:hypothetical protein MRS76_10330 [Rhizobiaceae bacterium n13]|uniref:Uncharacterized protein n=1 Tax=Ferirhizobium litorale TaxID=2927786 RepID=A0AAE3QFG8_9HYPH|nr:hypothetical protein [Fererhizobium litorale]MDI7862355.1 hypothetical protein [Fererhizobium litorale]MDI7922371.1 hypothetical protein [Fererhizobium litorale]
MTDKSKNRPPEADAIGQRQSARPAVTGSADSSERNAAAPAPGRTLAQPTAADQRKARAAAKLRENLMKRKQQVRARRAGKADETVGLPAAKSDESS